MHFWTKLPSSHLEEHDLLLLDEGDFYIFDEAKRAEIEQRFAHCRIVSLTATPGTDERQGEAEEILLRRLRFTTVQLESRNCSTQMTIESTETRDQVLEMARDRHRPLLVFSKDEALIQALRAENRDYLLDEYVLQALEDR